MKLIHNGRFRKKILIAIIVFIFIVIGGCLSEIKSNYLLLHYPTSWLVRLHAFYYSKTTTDDFGPGLITAAVGYIFDKDLMKYPRGDVSTKYYVGMTKFSSFCTDDIERARLAVEEALKDKVYLKQQAEAEEGWLTEIIPTKYIKSIDDKEKFFEFQVEPYPEFSQRPPFYTNVRVHKCSYISVLVNFEFNPYRPFSFSDAVKKFAAKNIVKNVRGENFPDYHNEIDIGVLNKRPITANVAKELFKYLWFESWITNKDVFASDFIETNENFNQKSIRKGFERACGYGVDEEKYSQDIQWIETHELNLNKSTGSIKYTLTVNRVFGEKLTGCAPVMPSSSL